MYFYTLYAAAQNDAVNLPHSVAISANDESVVFTDLRKEALFILPLTVAHHLFTLVEHNLEGMEGEKLEIPIGETRNFSSHLIEYVKTQLTACLVKMEKAQSAHNEKLFFKILKDFFDQGFCEAPHRYRPWTSQERIQIFNLLSYLGLRYNTHNAHFDDAEKTTEEILAIRKHLEAISKEEMLHFSQSFAFDIRPESLSLFNKESLLMDLRECNLPVISLTFDTLETFKNWIGDSTKKIMFPQSVILTIQERLYPEKLTIFNNLLNLFNSKRVTVEINPEFSATVCEMVGEEKIKSLNLMGSQIQSSGSLLLSYYLRRNKTLTSLNLNGNNIGYYGLAEFVKVLKNDTTLTSFNLTSNILKDDGVNLLTLLLATNQTLSELNLRLNGIKIMGAKRLAETLKNNTMITSLDFSFNPIKDEGAIAFAEMLKTNTTLKSLELINIQMGDAGAMALAEALEVNQTLHSLSLENNLIGEALKQELQQRFPGKVIF